MEIFGGFMVMISIIGMFWAVVWLIMPFVLFAVKGRQDRLLESLDGVEKRLHAIELQLAALESGMNHNDARPLRSSQDTDLMEESHDVASSG